MDGRGKRISDWKGIAAYFGRDERTVRRWEQQRGLPVHRIAGGARNLVYAYEAELEDWLGRMSGATASPAPAGPASPEAGRHAAATRPFPRPLWAGIAAMVVAIGLIGFLQFGALLPSRAGPRYVPAPEIQARYLEATYQLATRQEIGFRRAIEGLTEVTRLDPRFAAAFASLAEAYNTVSQFTLMPAEEAYPLAKEAAEQAIRLDPTLAHGHATLAFTEFYWERDFARSRALFERAIALDGGSAQTRHWFALTLMMTGDFETALSEIAAAQELNPESRVILANKGLILFHAGRAAEAAAILRQLADTEPNLRSPPEYLATIHLDQRDYPAFLERYRRAAEISGSEARRRIHEAAAAGFAAEGERGLLDAMFKAQQEEYAQGQETAYKLAATAALLGDDGKAIAYLETALAKDEQGMLGVLIDPAFKSLRGDPRYARIVEAVGFEPYPPPAGSM